MPFFRRRRKVKEWEWGEQSEERRAKLRGQGVHLMFSFTNPEEREELIARIKRQVGRGYDALHFHSGGVKGADAEALNQDIKVRINEGPDRIGKEYSVKHYIDDEGHHRVEVMWFRNGLPEDTDLRASREHAVFKIAGGNPEEVKRAVQKVRQRDPEGFRRLAELANVRPEHVDTLVRMIKRRLKGLE